MSASGIFIMVAGKPVDLESVSWIQVAPCGCTSAVTIAYSDYGAGPAHVVATAEQAEHRFGSSVAERKQDKDRGFTVKPIRRGDLDSMECHHSPKWGVEPRPTPDGTKWAVGGYYNERTRVLHLVPASSVETDDEKVADGHWRAISLCNVEKVRWTARWPDTDGKVECKRCIKVATEAVAS